jgi:hypothetical protein
MREPKTTRVDTRVGGMDIRCHTMETGWFHATCPSYREVMACAGESDKMIALADRHVLLSQSSFADHELTTLADLPFLVFGQVIQHLLEAGDSVKDDGSCHG